MTRSLFAAVLALGLAASAARAGAPKPPQPAASAPKPSPSATAEPACHEVVRYVCKIVPNIRARWVYECIDDPFCIQVSPKGHGCGHGCGHQGCGHHGCGRKSCDSTIPNCEGPYCRKQLVKRLIEEECGTRCVIEKIVEKVPIAVCPPGGCPGGLAPIGPVPAVEQLRSLPTPVAPVALPKRGL